MIAAISAECRRRGIDEETRRGIQRTVTGKGTRAEMTDADLGRVLDQIGGRRRHLALVSTDGGDGGSRDLMRGKIAAMLDGAGLPAAYGDAIARRMFRASVSDLDPTQLRAVIAALDRRSTRAAR